MNKSALVAALLAAAFAAQAKEDPKVTYVGQGRYTCSGNSPACAQVDANNRNQQERSNYEYKRSQDAAQAVVDRERRKEEDRKYGK